MIDLHSYKELQLLDNFRLRKIENFLGQSNYLATLIYKRIFKTACDTYRVSMQSYLSRLKHSTNIYLFIAFGCDRLRCYF